eukprot:gb/GECG01006825.1/.p1 GENE.gb/GECG01006825.1/~~gb/GECG01006825.1/.p1  ORF type:complete len:1010 (+),score=105.95 gb/GECG01006825.1/:1-3030(+)
MQLLGWSICLLSLWMLSAAHGAGIKHKGKYYDTTPKRRNGVLNVHMVPHTHDDVGWLKTVDEYYMGANNTIYHAGVQYILDSVTTWLQANPDRKFIYVEDAFFERWWLEQEEAKRDQVRELVSSGQLEFINGGWCMHDEATPSYVDMIDQTTLGNRFLFNEFGVVPKTAWQIDPFGHSGVQASLLTALSGYHGLYFARIDYQDKENRENKSDLELIWRGSSSLGKGAQAFTGVLYYHYCPPPGLCFDQSCNTATPVQDDSRIFGVNVDYLVNLFVEDALQQAEHYEGDIMFTMGCDFNYEQADEYYKNLDKLIHYVNQDGRVNAFYSTPSIYTEAKNKQNRSWTLKTDDFFPYADNTFAVWAGYFTSRPSLKGYVRDTSSFLQSMRTLLWAADIRDADIEFLEKAMGTLQHHDAVTGTERQHVAFDYAKRAAMGHDLAQKPMSEAIRTLTNAKVPGWKDCPLTNVSICDVSESNDNFAMVITNQVGQERSVFVRTVVSVKPTGSWKVIDSQGNDVVAQLLPLSQRDKSLRNINMKYGEDEVQWLVFNSRALPAYGFDTYFIQATSSEAAPFTSASRVRHLSNAPLRGVSADDFTIGNDLIELQFDGNSGLLKSAKNKMSSVSMSLEQKFMWWNASTGNGSGAAAQPSGAYVFRPNKTYAYTLADNVDVTTVEGPLIQEVRQTLTEWVSQVIRVGAKSISAEFEWTVGPIPIADGLGKEIISRFSSDLSTAETWYTDSNCRDFFKRRKNYRPTWNLDVTEPVADNYYPVDCGIYTNDSGDGRMLSIANDRAEGGSSLHDGELELMVHRRLLRDDFKGLDQALNESGLTGEGLITRGLHRVAFGNTSETIVNLRENFQENLFKPLIAYAPMNGIDVKTWLQQYTVKGSTLNQPLPKNVHLLTVDNQNYGSKVLIRLAHLYEKDEPAPYSNTQTIELANLFNNIKITSAEEYNLRANQPVTEFQPMDWKVDGESGSAESLLVHFANNPPSGANLSFTLRPMEIRTFICEYER